MCFLIWLECGNGRIDGGIIEDIAVKQCQKRELLPPFPDRNKDIRSWSHTALKKPFLGSIISPADLNGRLWIFSISLSIDIVFIFSYEKSLKIGMIMVRSALPTYAAAQPEG